MIRSFLMWLLGSPRSEPFSDFKDLLRVAENLEGANMRLASLLRAHVGFIDRMSLETGEDYRLAFTIYYLEHVDDFGEKIMRRNV